MSVYRALARTPPTFKPLLLGHTADGGEITIPYDQLQCHLHVMGLSGRGKSRAVEGLLQQMLENRQGFTFIDPHGQTYEALVAWIAAQGPRFLKHRKIHLFDPHNHAWRFGHNPLHVPQGLPAGYRDAYIMDQVDALMQSVSVVMGGEDSDKMPLYQRIFSTFMYTLATKGYTIFETMKALPATGQAFRGFLSHGLPDMVFDETWNEINSWAPKDYTVFVSSFYNRMHKLLRHPFMRHVFAQTDTVFDARRVMDEGDVVLVNLQQKPGTLSRPGAELIARLLINDYTQTAFGRVADKSRPHVLMVDESYRFITEDIEDILEGTRKFGLHLGLIHHYPGQLRRAGGNVFEGVMAGAQNKIFFGTSYSVAKELVDDLFAREYDFDRVKEVLNRQAAVGVERTTFRSSSTSSGYSEQNSRSSSSSSSHMSGSVHSYNQSSASSSSFDYDHYLSLLPRSWSEIEGVGSSVSESVRDSIGASESDSAGRSWNEGESEGVSEGLMPIFEVVPTSTYSPEEERHRHTLRISELEDRHFIMKYANGHRAEGKTIDVERPYIRPERVDDCVERLMIESDFVSPTEEVQQLIDDRWDLLAHETRDWQKSLKAPGMPKAQSGRFG